MRQSARSPVRSPRSPRSPRAPRPTRRRFRLTRSPFAFWLVAALLALVTASVVSGAIGRAESMAARYGPLTPVVVAARPVERGAALAGADLTVREVPAGFLPEGVFRTVDEVRGRAPVVPLLAGEPVLRGRLAPDGLSGVAALLPPGRRAMAVPTGGASPPLRKGDAVDVLATFDGAPAVAVAADATVLDVGTESATISVTPDEARAVAYALSQGGVTVVISGLPTR